MNCIIFNYLFTIVNKKKLWIATYILWMNFGNYKPISPHRFPVQLYYCEYCNLNETIFINIVDSIYLIEV